MGFQEQYLELLKRNGWPNPKGNEKNIAEYTDAELWSKALANVQKNGGKAQTAFEGLKQDRAVARGDTWFTGGAFEDGYDFGDLTRTVFGTASDAVDDLFTGAVGIVEPVIDTGATLAGGVGSLFGADEFADDMRKFIKDDLIDEEAVGEGLGYINPAKWGNALLGGSVEENSVLGEKADALAQSGGQLAATVGLQAVHVPWWVTTSVTSFGSEAEAALKEGGGYGEATLRGVVSAGAEVLTEKLFGGSGLKEKGLFNLDGLTKGIANKAVKALADFGVDMAAEGIEEVASEFINNLGSALYKEEDLGTILASEEALEGYIDAFIGGAILSGTMNVGKVTNSVKKGQDYRTGLSANEQKVFDSEYQKRLSEAGEISKKEKAKIYDEVMEDFGKGYFSPDSIKNILGEEASKAYEEAFTNEESIRKEYEELGKKKTLDAAEKERYEQLKQQMKLLDNGFIKNSFAEQGRRKQRFEADLSQYTDENARKTVENAMKYGLHNGTDAHEFVDFAAKIAAKKGYVVDFTNTRMLKDSVANGNEYGIDADAANVEAFVSESKKTIVVNMNAKRSLHSLVGHEVTHTLETAKAYDQLQKYITEYAKQKGEYDTRLSDIEGRYKGVKADIQKELTADLSGDYLLTDYDFIQQLATKDRNVFQKVYDEIKYLFKLATTGSKEARALEKAKHYYEKALREATKADKTAEGNKYSLSDSDGKKLTKEQSEYFKDSKMRDEEGNLKVMYHGSQYAGFHVFDPNMSDDDTSFFFTDRNDVAASYSGTTETYAPSVMQTAEDVKRFIATIVTDGKGYDVYEEDGKFKLSYKWEVVAESDTAQGIYEEFCEYEGVGYGEANYKVYLNLTNPLEIDAKGSNWSNIDFTPEEMKPLLQKYEELKAENREKNREVKAYAKAQGITIGEAQDRVRGYWDIVEQVGELEERMEKTLGSLGMQGEVNTRVISKYAKAHGYDGVIFNNIHDNGGYSNGSEGASTVAIAFNSEQIKSVANATPTSDPDIRYSLSADSQGRELSKEQREYFKDTKIKDQNGNLLVMYHGTKKGGFTVFHNARRPNTEGFYFTNDKGYSDIFQGINTSTGKYYDSVQEGIDEGYFTPETYEVYLNVKNPFVLTADQQDIIEDIGYWENIYKPIKNAGYDGVMMEDMSQVFVFDSSQIKRVDNANPSDDPDIRYSLSAETDKQYLDAVNRGDTAAAQKMVDKAAENAGYTIKAYHGTPNTEFTVFDKERLGKGNDQYGAGFYFTTDKTGATHYGNRVIDAVLDIKNPIRFTATADSGRNLIDADVELTSKQAYEVVKRLPGIYDAEESPLGDYFDAYWEVGAKDWMIRELAEQYRDVGYLDSDLFRNYPNELHEALRDVVGYDGVEVTFESTGEKFYVAWFDNQMKSADPVTYDDNGNVIPLSERFNTGNNDIRHSLARGTEKTYGNYNVYGKDLELAPTAEDDAPVAKKAVDDSATAEQTAEAKVEKPKQAGNATADQEEKIAQIRKATPKGKEGSWFTRAIKKLNRAVTVVGDKGWEIENLSKKTGNRELEAKYDFMKNRSSGVAQEYIHDNLLPIIDKIEKYGEDFDLYTRHLHNINRMSLDSESDKARRAEIKSQLEGYTEKQIKALASEKITSQTTEDRAKQIRLAQEYMELGGERGKNKPVFGDSVTAEVSRKKVAEYEAANPEFKPLAKEVHDYFRELRKYAVNQGLIEKPVADEWEQMYPYYVPTRRTDKQGANVSVPLDTRKTGINNPFKRATGGNSDFEPLSDTMAKYTMQIFRAVHRNSFGIELKNALDTLNGKKAEEAEETKQSVGNGTIPAGTKVKASDRNNIGEIVSYDPETGKYAVFFKNAKGQSATVKLGADILTPLDDLKKKAEESEVLKGDAENDGAVLTPAQNGKPPSFTVFVKGKRVTFDITEELYQAIKPAEGILADTYTIPNKFAEGYKKLLTEYDPFFALLRNPIKDAKDVLFNSRHAWKTYIAAPKAFFEIKNKGEYYKEYIQNGGKTTSYYNSDKGEFTKGEIMKPKSAKGVFTFPWRSYKNASEKLEMFWRLSEYIASREAGESIEKAMLDSARVTTNFGAGGDLTKWANRNGAMFLNPSVQGAMQIGRNVREAYHGGLKGSAILAAKVIGVGLSGMMFNWLLWDDDEEYAELSDYVKQNYFIVGKTEDGKFIRIPKGRMEAVIQNGFEQMANLITGNDDVDFETFWTLVKNNLAPNSFSENNILSPLLQAKNNETWYGGELVPSRLQDFPVAEQFDESTDAVSKWLGEVFNISPYKINYVLKQYGGGLADLVLPALTEEAEGSTLLAPIADQFVSDSLMKNQSITDFYDLKDELTANANSVHATDEDVLKNKYFSHMNSEISDLYKQKRAIQNSDLPDSEKYAAVREVQKQIVELAKASLDTYDSVTINGEYATVGGLHFRLNDKGEWAKMTDKQVERMAVFTRSIEMTESDYLRAAEELSNLDADKDENGNSISGSRKQKVIEYINSLDVDYGAKIILYKSEYPSDDTYNADILDYLNRRGDLSYDDIAAILRELGFTVYADGSVEW